MKKQILLFLIALLPALSVSAQNKVTLKGYLKDGSDGEGLIGATIFAKEAGTGAVTNVYGFYALTLPAGQYTFTFSYVGYQSVTQTIDLQDNATLNLELTSADTRLEEVVVTGEAEDEALRTVEMSTIKLKMAQIKKMPQFLGETDIIRSIQLLPGVTTVGEGATGFNVRGGNIDQNLILLDEAPIYSSSHLFGFFSIFNGDAVKDVKLYKGGIPANFGGRLSSVLDVRQKEGNNKNFAMTGGIGAVSSRLTLEGPIVKDKASFMLAGRRSYVDLFLLLSGDEILEESSLFFYDLNTKLNWKIGEKDQVFLSGYFGRDAFNYAGLFGADWGNTGLTFRWNHVYGSKLFSNVTAIYSDYRYKLSSSGTDNAFEWTSNILNYKLKADFTWFAGPKNTLDFGASLLRYKFKPGLVESQDFNLEMDHKHALETAIYVSNEQKAGEAWTLKYGLRYSFYTHFGEAIVHTYETGVPKTPETITESKFYKSGEIVQTYGGFEPRLSMNYRLNPEVSLKASYNRTRQYIHLISNTTAATPLDVWTSADKHIKPAIADQLALGYFRNFKKSEYEFSTEVFYKISQDLVDYKNGAQLLFNSKLEAELLTGKGRAYGLEVMLKKQKGRLNGWLSYTLSRAEIRVDSDIEVERINNGNWYPSNYDKLHDLSAVLSYDLNEKWTLSANFAYMTGRPVTYPDSKYEYDGITAAHFGNRNGARTPDYHRLDFSANYEKKKPGSRLQSSWNFSVYNLYGRKNAYSVYFRANEDNPQQTEAVRLSILGSILPSVTYNFKF